MTGENEGQSSDGKSPEDALLDLLARLIARRFLQEQASMVSDEKTSSAVGVLRTQPSLDLEEENE